MIKWNPRTQSRRLNFYHFNIGMKKVWKKSFEKISNVVSIGDCEDMNFSSGW